VPLAGLVPEALEQALHRQAAAGRRARVLYTIPHGQNPTGATMSAPRKRAIYAICSKHDVVIIEDDAYAYLQFPKNGGACPGVLCVGSRHVNSTAEPVAQSSVAFRRSTQGDR
jgi:DNA-binding transcriptional MocR family regulator